MNKYVEISKKFVCTILSNNAEPTTDGLAEILEIRMGNEELLLEHLKSPPTSVGAPLREVRPKSEQSKFLLITPKFIVKPSILGLMYLLTTLLDKLPS